MNGYQDAAGNGAMDEDEFQQGGNDYRHDSFDQQPVTAAMSGGAQQYQDEEEDWEREAQQKDGMCVCVGCA